MTSRHVPASLVRAVRNRASDTCEYCRLPQQFQEATFHIDHVQPRAESGKTTLNNLALACVSCSLSKSDRLASTDPATQQQLALFNPRVDAWDEHFSWGKDGRIVGISPCGRATIAALRMNRPSILAIRRLLARFGPFPLHE